MVGDMNNNKSILVDKRATLVVVGCLVQYPSLLDDIDRPLSRDDFSFEPFHDIIYSTIYNLYIQGCQKLDEYAIDSFVARFPNQYKIFQDNKGIEYISTAMGLADIANYDYYYHRIKKYSLLRYYENLGYNTSTLFNLSEVDPTKLEIEQQKLDNITEREILEQIEVDFIITPKMNFCSDTLTVDSQAGDGLDDLVDEFMETPDVGLPLSSLALNTVARGARRGCLYMRSAPSSGGKSRFAAADACRFAVPYYYDVEKNKWEYTGLSEPTLYITTEMEIEEIKTLLIAAVSGVNEEHILYGEDEEGEIDRIRKANQYIKSSPLYICHIPDFSISDIENVIKKYKREKNVNYFFFDYIVTSIKLMNEIGSKSGMRLREAQLLVLFVTKLKAICQQLDIFMMTASQLSGDYQNALVKDQTLLAGAKALVNKLDIGVICMAPSQSELEKVDRIIQGIPLCPVPNMVTWIYKVRRGRLTRLCIWQHVNLGTMRIRDLFVTTTNFELINIDFNQIEIKDVETVINEHSIKMSDMPEKSEEETEEPKSENEFSF